MTRKTKIPREVDCSPLLPGEKELLEGTLKKVLAARAKKAAASVNQ